jgi:hypothetical protein
VLWRNPESSIFVRFDAALIARVCR